MRGRNQACQVDASQLCIILQNKIVLGLAFMREGKMGSHCALCVQGDIFSSPLPGKIALHSSEG